MNILFCELKMIFLLRICLLILRCVYIVGQMCQFFSHIHLYLFEFSKHWIWCPYYFYLRITLIYLTIEILIRRIKITFIYFTLLIHVWFRLEWRSQIHYFTYFLLIEHCSLWRRFVIKVVNCYRLGYWWLGLFWVLWHII